VTNDERQLLLELANIAILSDRGRSGVPDDIRERLSAFKPVSILYLIDLIGRVRDASASTAPPAPPAWLAYADEAEVTMEFHGEEAWRAMSLLASRGPDESGWQIVFVETNTVDPARPGSATIRKLRTT
jgi:hypothetical protein